ncbi:hypothetical protein M8J77_017480 [Diaphorina citri]|nr:hypothetical protein M8J77_017480 [Diaphorina citri]
MLHQSVELPVLEFRSPVTRLGFRHPRFFSQSTIYTVSVSSIVPATHAQTTLTDPGLSDALNATFSSRNQKEKEDKIGECQPFREPTSFVQDKIEPTT